MLFGDSGTVPLPDGRQFARLSRSWSKDDCAVEPPTKTEYRKSSNYLTRSLVELTSVGQNTSISRINEKLESFPAWDAGSIERRHGMLMALARDVWKTTPIEV